MKYEDPDHRMLYEELTSSELRTVGCYLLGDTIGQGTYGTVRQATHQLTGQQVAVKIVDKTHAPLVVHEVDTLRRLRHPHIAQLLEVVVTETRIYIVTELARGGEAFDHLTRRGKLDEPLARRWFAQLVSAVGYCHSRMFLHRDLKLENMMLDSEDTGNIKLIDFGFSAMMPSPTGLDSGPQLGELPVLSSKRSLLQAKCGSIAYAAPELLLKADLAGKKADYSGEEADIWSMGIILYTLLCGYLPFDDDDEDRMKKKILEGRLDFPDHLSAGARDLLVSLMQLRPERRLGIDEIAAHPWLLGPVDTREETDYLRWLLGPLRRQGLGFLVTDLAVEDEAERFGKEEEEEVEVEEESGGTDLQDECCEASRHTDGSAHRHGRCEPSELRAAAALAAMSRLGLDAAGVADSLRRGLCDARSALFRLLQEKASYRRRPGAPAPPPSPPFGSASGSVAPEGDPGSAAPWLSGRPVDAADNVLDPRPRPVPISLGAASKAPAPAVRTPAQPRRQDTGPSGAAQRRIIRRRRNNQKGRTAIEEESEQEEKEEERPDAEEESGTAVTTKA